jgi:hypothetical protein
MEPAQDGEEFGKFRRAIDMFLGDVERRRRRIIHLQHYRGDGSHTILLHYPRP